MAQARAKNATAFFISAAIISAGAIVAIAASKKNEVQKEQTYNSIDATNTLVETSTVAIAENADVRSENNWTTRKSLSEAFLRKTTLLKGYFIDGEVHFPYYGDANWYRLVFSVGKSKVDFHFKQKLIHYQPVPYSTSN